MSYPGAQSAAEKALKMQVCLMAGKTNYPVGLLAGGKTFCPEEAIIELEVARAIYCLYGGCEVTAQTLGVDAIRDVGIGGSVLDHEHTLRRFRDALHGSSVFDRSAGKPEDMLAKANRRWKDILQSSRPYALSGDKALEIDRIVARAEKFFEEKGR